MAQVDVSLTFAQLLNIASELQVPLDFTKKLQKWDLVKALREHTLANVITSKPMLELYESVKPFFNTLSSPQLCYPYELLDPVSKREVFNSADWIFEEKMNGFRATMTFIDKKPVLWSRTIDAASFFPVMFSNLAMQGFKYLGHHKDLPSFVLDGELLPEKGSFYPFHNGIDYLSYILDTDKENSLRLQRENPVSFYPFDILYYDGESVVDLPLFERAKLLESLLVRLEQYSPQIRRVPRTLQNKAQFLDRMFRSGSEGAVAKNLHSTYNPSGLRKKDAFVKVKRSYFLNGEVLLLQDTMDGWISNAFTDETGAITDIEVSTYIRNGEELTPHILARVPIPFSQRTPFLRFKEGSIYYEPLLGTVVEIDGKGFHENGMLDSPILLRFRMDKQLGDCIIDHDDLTKRINKEAIT